MKTIRYKSEYYTQVAELLRVNRNIVKLPSDIFFDIARLFENEHDNAEKIGKLLSRAYTVLALEDDKIVGISSMDKDGNIGILYVSDGETFSKACRLMLNALYRRAAQKDLPYLFVLPVDADNKLFKEFGYLQFDNGECDVDANNAFMLAKKIESEKYADMSEESVKRLELDPTKKITVEGKVSVFPAVFFGIACFLVMLLTILTATSSEPLSSFAVFFVVIGILFAAAAAIFICYLVRGRQLRNKVLHMRVTNGVIKSLVETAVRTSGRNSEDSGYAKVHITYVFYDDKMQKRTGEFSHKYNRNAPYFYEGQELVIAYSENESYILRHYTLTDQKALPADERSETTSDGTAKAVNIANKNMLLKYVPINAVKMYKIYALSLLLMLAILLTVGVIFSTVVAAQSTISFWKEMLSFVPMFVFGLVVFGIPSAVFLIIPKRTMSKYYKLLNSSGARVTDGKIHTTAKTYKSDNKLKFYCEYNDGTSKKKVPVPRMFASSMIKSGNTSVKVVFDNYTAIVLVKNDRYPNKFY
ncbi:MAG: hypothetical protein K2J01_04535 [Clostridiales bacterium]|nr:hypothetical protein [Clostridiales bacterium]